MSATHELDVQPLRTSLWRRAPATVLYIAAVALLAHSFGRLVEYDHWAITCPYEIEYGEGIVLQNAVNIAHGRTLYTDYHRYPYVVATYPPVYPLLTSTGIWLFGVSFAFGRAVSALAALATAVLIWLILRRSVRARWAAAAAAAFFLAAPITCWWGVVMRVDMMAVFLGIASLYCVARGGRSLVVAAVLMTLAIYTRQSEVAPLAAGVTYLWWIGQRRNAVLLGTSCVTAVLALFAALQVTSHGWFFQHIVVANRNLWELRYLVSLWRSTFLSCPFPFAAGVLGAATALVPDRVSGSHADRRAGQPTRLLVLYFVFAMLVSATGGKIGATVNYMVEPLAASCLMCGVAIDRLAQRRQKWQGEAAWAALWLALIGSLVFPLIAPEMGPKVGDRHWRQDTVRGGAAAVSLIRHARGDILSEDTGLLPITGRPILLDPHKMTSMFRDGNWSQRQLIKDIDRRRFALIILRWDPIGGATDEWATYGGYRWSIGMGRAIMRNYYLRGKAGDLYFVAPADSKHPTCAEMHRQLVERSRAHRSQ
ncbi:MAG: glycosyltransferase family 39 protein [Armatimonadota bacterium]|nr:MAG: glycosyltransferase family 39 protein [Armatimonadota bacterium]